MWIEWLTCPVSSFWCQIQKTCFFPYLGHGVQITQLRHHVTFHLLVIELMYIYVDVSFLFSMMASDITFLNLESVDLKDSKHSAILWEKNQTTISLISLIHMEDYGVRLSTNEAESFEVTTGYFLKLILKLSASQSHFSSVSQLVVF